MAFLPGVGGPSGTGPGAGAPGSAFSLQRPCHSRGRRARAFSEVGRAGAAAPAAWPLRLVWFGIGWMTLGGVTQLLLEKKADMRHDRCTAEADSRGRDRRSQGDCRGGEADDTGMDAAWNF